MSTNTMSNIPTRQYRPGKSQNSQFLFVLVGLLVLATGLYLAVNWLFSHQ